MKVEVDFVRHFFHCSDTWAITTSCRLTSAAGEAVGLEAFGFADGEDALGLVATNVPLSHCRFLPTFTHVNFLPEATDVCPAFAQVDPALTAEKLDSVLAIEITTDKLKTKVRLVREMSLMLEL